MDAALHTDTYGGCPHRWAGRVRVCWSRCCVWRDPTLQSGTPAPSTPAAPSHPKCRMHQSPRPPPAPQPNLLHQLRYPYGWLLSPLEHSKVPRTATSPAAQECRQAFPHASIGFSLWTGTSLPLDFKGIPKHWPGCQAGGHPTDYSRSGRTYGQTVEANEES